MSIDPRNHNWDRQLEKGLPDCRVHPLNRERSLVVVGRQQWDVVFCAQCHQPKGATPPIVPHVFFLCDDCFFAGGTPPGCVKVAD